MGSFENPDPQERPQPQGSNRLPQRSDGVLMRTVEDEIIPRLVRAHSQPAQASVSPQDLEHFTDQLLNADDAALHQSLQNLRQRGVSVQGLFLDLLTPAARRLGDFWTCDSCSFTDVTVAMGRLQQLLRANSSAFGLNNISQGRAADRRVLLMPCPGEQHTFGLSIVAEFFYRAGWDVTTSFMQPSASLAQLVERQWFDVIGLSLGDLDGLGRLNDCVRQIRRASTNPQVPILVGGSVFVLNPGLAGQTIADAVVVQADAAPEMAQRLLERQNAGA
ncbi:MAG: cobalamin B12-binding domain-containing protein [Betaproteobacteria bacterium]|nr:cobalamin B12-binding domain-containing protein [Betaproteobacteria bacterium]